MYLIRKKNGTTIMLLTHLIMSEIFVGFIFCAADLPVDETAMFLIDEESIQAVIIYCFVICTHCNFDQGNMIL